MLAGDHMVQGDNYLYHGIAMQKKNPSAPYAIVYSAPVMGFAGVAVINKNTPHPYAAALWTDWTLTEESQKFVAEQLRGPIALKHPYLPDSVKIVDLQRRAAGRGQAASGHLEQIRGRNGIEPACTRTAAAPPLSSPQTERRFFLGWRELTLALLIALLAYQVVIPFVMIIWTSLKTARPGEPEFLSLLLYARAIMRAPSAAPRSGARPATRCLRAGVDVRSPSRSAPLSPGWSSAPTRRLRRSSASFWSARIIIPGVLIVISWILIASPNIGLVNQLARSLTGIATSSTSTASGAWSGCRRWKWCR